ncbi:hypothetical protein GGI20_002165 [Coemansia sp. BCRC 34301]|nr:hypothetical protein GGI20_002165 [Coemansia sp. BCRC 34301]
MNSHFNAGDSRRQAQLGNDATDVLAQLSMEIGAGLTKNQIAAAMTLMRQGVNPSAMVAITQELRREAQTTTSQQNRHHQPQ